MWLDKERKSNKNKKEEKDLEKNLIVSSSQLKKNQTELVKGECNSLDVWIEETINSLPFMVGSNDTTKIMGDFMGDLKNKMDNINMIVPWTISKENANTHYYTLMQWLKDNLGDVGIDEMAMTLQNLKILRNITFQDREYLELLWL